jgi:hypothetical protein
MGIVLRNDSKPDPALERVTKAWDEHLHPRGHGGRWIPKIGDIVQLTDAGGGSRTPDEKTGRVTGKTRSGRNVVRLKDGSVGHFDDRELKPRTHADAVNEHVRSGGKPPRTYSGGGSAERLTPLKYQEMSDAELTSERERRGGDDALRSISTDRDRRAVENIDAEFTRRQSVGERDSEEHDRQAGILARGEAVLPGRGSSIGDTRVGYLTPDDRDGMSPEQRRAYDSYIRRLDSGELHPATSENDLTLDELVEEHQARGNDPSSGTEPYGEKWGWRPIDDDHNNTLSKLMNVGEGDQIEVGAHDRFGEGELHVRNRGNGWEIKTDAEHPLDDDGATEYVASSRDEYLGTVENWLGTFGSDGEVRVRDRGASG